MNHVSGPTQGHRKTLTRVGIEPKVLLCPCVGPFPSVGLTLTWFIWDRNLALHITLCLKYKCYTANVCINVTFPCSGRILLSSELNILPLFTDIKKNNCCGRRRRNPLPNLGHDVIHLAVAEISWNILLVLHIFEQPLLCRFLAGFTEYAGKSRS